MVTLLLVVENIFMHHFFWMCFSEEMSAKSRFHDSLEQLKRNLAGTDEGPRRVPDPVHAH